MNKKLQGNGIVFFCRAYNDIDHMTPIIYKMKQTQVDIEIELIIYDFKKTYFDDFRIIYLDSIGIKIYHIFDLISVNRRLVRFYLNEYYKRNNPGYTSIRRILSNRLLIPLEKHFSKKIKSLNGEKFINNCFFNLPKAIVFDQSYVKFYQNIVRVSKKMGIKTIAVPHGHNILDNELIWDKSMEIYPEKATRLTGKDSMTKMPFDFVVFENHRISKRYVKLGVVSEDQATVLGSTRFSDEWIKKIREIIPVNRPNFGEDVLKVVIMLSKPTYNGFTDELIRSIEYVSKFPDVFLIVKPHTRRKRFNHFDNFDNIFIDNNHEYDSPNLIDWADLVMFEHSCICFDSVKNDKPTLYLKNTHANILMSESIFNSWQVDCRDDIRSFMWKFIEDKNSRTYSKEDARKFCKDVIEPEGKDVLNNYVNFIVNDSHSINDK
tara:strand:- start:1382 stop:2683 length:1302 start_codon:yes stop_codon:yes gene_type:complete